jgi:hypothetical protein
MEVIKDITFSPPFAEILAVWAHPWEAIGFSPYRFNDCRMWCGIVSGSITNAGLSISTFIYYLKAYVVSISPWVEVPVNEYTPVSHPSRVRYAYTIVARRPINPPSNLQAEVLEERMEKIKLTWTDESDNELGFIIYRSTNGIDFIEHKRISSPNPEGSGYTVVYEDEDNIQIGQNYWYKIKAYAGEYTSSFSNIAGPVKVPWLNAPTNLTADAVSYTTVKLQ